MKRFVFFVMALAAVVGVSAGTALSAEKAEKPVLLQVPVAFATSLPGLGDGIMYVANNIEAVSGGSLKMKVFEPGKLVAPFEILDAVSKGKVNAGYATAGYWEGKLRSAPLFAAVPFGPETGEYLGWFYYGNGMKLYQEMYDKAGYNVHVLLAAIIAPETSGWFTKEINSPADIKGLRMRFFGLGGKVMEKLGVSVSLLPAGEIFPALEKKALDATEFSMPAIDERLGFYKIAKYNYYPGWHQQATTFELLINKDVWNGMSKRQQQAIEVLCKASVADSFAHTEAIQGKVMRENIEKRGVKNMKWSKEMLALYKKTWNEVAAEESAKDPFFKKVWDDFREFDKDYDLWSSHAFMPR